MHEAGIEIQILSIGLLVLASYFVGKLTRHIKVGETTEHLQMLAAIAFLARDEENREALRHAADAHDVLGALKKVTPA